MSVEDRVKTAIGKLGENIKVSRFARFELGA
jgi:translation elongation factor EF-Ts